MKNTDKKSFINLSKDSWVPPVDNDITSEDIQLGALLRIAISLETMATPYVEALSEAQRYKKYYYDYVGRVNKMDRQIAALRGVITRLKNKNK